MNLSSNVIRAKASLKDTVTIDFSEDCNIHCLGCPRKVRLKNWQAKNYWKLDEAKQLVDFIMKKLSPHNIDIGVLAEFCIYRYNAEILEYLYTNYPDVRILITTNLTCLSDKLLKAIEKATEKIVVNCSLWTSDPEMYKTLHGADFFDRVDTNLNKLLSIKTKANIMVSTIEYNDEQLAGMQKYIQGLASKHGKTYAELTGARNFVPGYLTLYRNVYMPEDINHPPKGYKRRFNRIEYVCNTSNSVAWECDMIRHNAYFTYNRCYACVNIAEPFEFSIKNLDDLLYKLNKQLALENKMDICKTCSIGYCCMGKGH